jgi:hypothetical protein
MHVSLARRLQRRTSQLTARLDTAERDELDQNRLAFLFGLDHLVTLMRRTTDSLLVLGGHGPGGVRGAAVPMLDVLRGASSRIEDYARVGMGVVDEDLCVAGHAADELALLLSELMDNAAAHSRDPVTVHARRLADRAVVQVIDLGIGLDERRRRVLNERLASPVVDVAAVSRMGLTVVGLLAAHHGLHVELRANLPRGTIAEVVLPTPLLRFLVGQPRPGTELSMMGAPVAGAPVNDGRHRARPQAGLPAPRPRGAAATEPTAELPVLSAHTTNGLPVREPQAHAFPTRTRPDRGARAHRDPRRVAEDISAYARGVDLARSHGLRRQPSGDSQLRPGWTDNQGA